MAEAAHRIAPLLRNVVREPSVQPTAVAWLKIVRDTGSELPLGSQVRRTAIRRLRETLRWES